MNRLIVFPEDEQASAFAECKELFAYGRKTATGSCEEVAACDGRTAVTLLLLNRKVTRGMGLDDAVARVKEHLIWYDKDHPAEEQVKV